MMNKTRKRLWPAAMALSFAVVGVVAALVVLAAYQPGLVSAHGPAICHTALHGLDPQCATLVHPHDDGNDGNGGNGNGGNGTQPPAAAPSDGFVAKAVAGRMVELKWTGVSGATSYVVRYRNLDAGASWTTVNVPAGTTYTLRDDDLVDGALYEVQVYGNNQSLADARSLQILGPIIQFSSDVPYESDTGEPIEFELPYATQAKGNMVRYSIVPALPKGLDYGRDAGDDYVDLATSVNPRITGAVAHTTGGSDLFYRLEGCDVEDSVVDADSCDTHIFRIIITPADVKPLADVIRDRVYTIGEALNPTHPQNLLPRVGLGAENGFTYELLDVNGDYKPVNIGGVMFNATTRQLSGTPTGPEAEYRVAYRAQQAGNPAYHEAEFTIKIVEIQRQECLVGLNYETTQRYYNTTAQVGSANFTVGSASGPHYVLPIGEKGQQGAGKSTTRAFELITVKKGGDLSAAGANELPAGLQVVKLMVDGASVNPQNDLYTRQGPYTPSGEVMAQMMVDGMYTDPEPDYPDMDNGYRLAIGVSDASMLKVGEYQSCFIVHDTDDQTGETDSSAVVFYLNVRPDLSARDWVIELEDAGDMSELDVSEAFTTEPSLLNFEVMYVDDGAARNAATGCIASRADNPADIVSWSTENDTVTFTAKEVAEETTQRVQVKALLKSGGSEACVQVRITVLAEPVPMDLTRPTAVSATVVGNSVTVTWVDGDNALQHMVLLLDADYAPAKPAATNQTDGETTFTDVPDGSYTVVVVAVKSASDYLYTPKAVQVGQ